MDELSKKLVAEYGEEPERVAMAETFAAVMIRHITFEPDMKCLEFGCGRGNLALMLPEDAAILATDPSAEGIEVLKQKITGLNRRNITPAQNDILELTANGRFDLIYSTLAMHHIADIDALLEKCVRMLAPGGRLVLVDLDTEDGTFHDDNSQIHHFGFDREWLRHELIRHGLTVSHLDEIYRRVKERPDGTRIYPMFIVIAEKVKTAP